jgi:uncharacterized protein
LIMKHCSVCLSVFLAVLFIVGCSYVSTNNKFFEETSLKAYNGNYQGAIASVTGAKESIYKFKDRVMYYLDLGMLYHYSGDYAKSNEMLTAAEEAIYELFTKSVSKAALSLLLNDNTLDYGGEDYEDIYLNVFKALNYIKLKDSDAAFVEVRKVNDKLAELEDKYSDLSKKMNSSKDAAITLKPGDTKFHNSALARYISLLLYRDKKRWDDVRIDSEKFAEAWLMQSGVYNFARPDLSESLDRAAEGRLNILSFTGRSPAKRARTLWIRTFKDHIFIGTSRESLSGEKVTNYLDMYYWKDIPDNLFFKFQFPVMESRKSEVYSIKVQIDGKVYEPALVESIDNVATSTFEIKKDMIYLKTIIRTVTKGLLSKQGKDKIDEQVGDEFLSSLLNLGADLAISATEQADLRVSHYFPKLAHISEIHLTPGPHDVNISYYNKYGNIIYKEDLGIINIEKDRLNLVESFCLQ